MNRFLLGLALLICLAVPACQCSNKPEIGPVEGASSTAQAHLTLPQVG